MAAPDERPWIAIGVQWASRVITISIGMVVPGLVGHWVDDRLGTKVLFLLLGLAFGMGWGLWQLMRITRTPPNQQAAREDR